MPKRSGKKRSGKKRSGCNTHKKSKTCPKTKCSWVSRRKNSKGNSVRGHCKGKGSKKTSKKARAKVSLKKTKKVSNCKGKKSSPCKRSKKCNWTKSHKNKNGLKIKGFCKSNPLHTKVSTPSDLVPDDSMSYGSITGENPLMMGDDDSSSSSSSSGLSLNINTPPGSAGQLYLQNQGMGQGMGQSIGQPMGTGNQLLPNLDLRGVAHGNPNNNPGNNMINALFLSELLK